MSMKTIKLYGHLGKKFGKIHRFDVRSPSEAIQALSANYKDFKAYLLEHSEPGYHVFLDEENIGVDKLGYPVEKTIKFVPVVQGAGGDGFGQILLGAALIFVAPYAVTALGMGSTLAGAYAIQAATGLGWAMIFGGVSQMLFSPPETQSGTSVERPDNKPSYAFDGPVNTTRQGNPVPVGYGRLRVGSQVVSAGLFSEAI